MALVHADCADDGDWPGTQTGLTAALDCKGEFIGKMTRDCYVDGWKEVDTTYCLPKTNPNPQNAFVDFTYRLTYAKFSGFRKSTENFKRAILSAYSTILNDGEVAIYRVSQGSISNSVNIQVRIDCERARAISFYSVVEKEVSEEDKTKKPVLAIVKNQNEYVSDSSRADLTYVVTPILSVTDGYCEADGEWPRTEMLATAALDCDGDYVGKKIRDCTVEGWGDVDTTYCLPKFPLDENMAYVDFTYRITYAKLDGLKTNTTPLKRAILSAYNSTLRAGEVTIHRVSAGDSESTVDIQVRVACEKKRGLSFYEQVKKEVSEKDKTKKPVLAIVKNQPTYVSDPAMADLTYAVEPTYSVAKMLITASVIWVIAGVLVIIVLVLLCICLCVCICKPKEKSPKKGPKQMKLTSKV